MRPEGSLESLLNTTHWLQTGSQALELTARAGSQGLALQAQGDSAAAFRSMCSGSPNGVLEDFSSLGPRPGGSTGDRGWSLGSLCWASYWTQPGTSTAT